MKHAVTDPIFGKAHCDADVRAHRNTESLYALGRDSRKLGIYRLWPGCLHHKNSCHMNGYVCCLTHLKVKPSCLMQHCWCLMQDLLLLLLPLVCCVCPAGTSSSCLHQRCRASASALTQPSQVSQALQALTGNATGGACAAGLGVAAAFCAFSICVPQLHGACSLHQPGASSPCIQPL
jgi:hypothetical protein